MGGNSFGTLFRVTTFGESHGKAVGVIVDGCPAGMALKEDDVQRELDRRRPGQGRITTGRKEEDRVTILSGVFEGKTTGAPLAMMVHNRDVDSMPYLKNRDLLRPSHADFTYRAKYGHVDPRGGGRSSGRETVGRVAAGAVARKLLSGLGIEIIGHTVKVHDVSASPTLEEIRKNAKRSGIGCADPEKAKEMEAAVLKAKEEGDSVGGVVEVLALDVPPGLGEPVFDKLDADLAKAVMSVGAVKGIEIGAGFELGGMKGSEANDAFRIEGKSVSTRTNRSGGIQGGISNGMPVIVRAAIKPTSSIAKEQDTVDVKKMRKAGIKVEGRHDPCIVPRVLPVLEAMVAIVLADHAMRQGLLAPARFI